MAWTDCDCEGEFSVQLLKYAYFAFVFRFLPFHCFSKRSFVVQMLQVEKAQNTVALNEFEIEVELLSRLNNPGIIQILGWLFLLDIDSFRCYVFSFISLTHYVYISYY